MERRTPGHLGRYLDSFCTGRDDLARPKFEGFVHQVTTKLLAVDDSKTMRRVLEIAFSGDEFHLTTAASAQEALAALGSGSPDVALVDGYLGTSNGYDLVREIKAASPRTRVLVLSSKQRPYDEGAGQSAGADGTFEKPFDSTKLLARVAELSSAAPAPVAAPPIAAAPRPVAVSAPAAPPPLAPAPVAARPSAASPLPPSAAPAAPRSSTAQRPPAPAARASAAPPQIAPLSAPAASAPRGSAPLAAVPNAAIAAATGSLATQLAGLGLSREQVEAVLALSRDVVEQVVWEVVPVLAETLIKEEIARLTAD